MKAIWKFPLKFTAGWQPVRLPVGAIPVRFGIQNDTPCLWAEVDPEAKPVIRNFAVYGTGHAIDDDTRYVGSCDHGPFVWHLFEQWRQ